MSWLAVGALISASVPGCADFDWRTPCTSNSDCRNGLYCSGGTCSPDNCGSMFCDDGNECTTDTCSESRCRYSELPEGTECGDEQRCARVWDGETQGLPPMECAHPDCLDCVDEDDCNHALCDPFDGTCELVPLSEVYCFIPFGEEGTCENGVCVVP